MEMYVYINVKGRIIEAIPDEVEERRHGYNGIFLDGYNAKFKNQINAEEKRKGWFIRHLSDKPEKIYCRTLWLPNKDFEKAKEIFKKDAEKRYKKISMEFDSVLEELETLNGKESK